MNVQPLRRLRRLSGPLGVLTVRVVAAVIQIAIVFLLSKTLSSQDIGIYFTFLTIVTLGSVLSRFGLGLVLVAEISGSTDTEGQFSRRRILGELKRRTRSLSLFGGCVVVVSAAPLAGYVGLDVRVVLMSAAGLMLQTELWMNQEYLRAVRRVGISQILNPIAPNLLFVAIYVFFGAPDILFVIALYCVSLLVTSVASTCLLPSIRQPRDGDPLRLRLLYKKGLDGLLNEVSTISVLWLPNIFLLKFSVGGASTVAVFAVLMRVARPLTIVRSAISLWIGPRFGGETAASIDPSVVLERARKGAALAAVLCAPFALAILIWAEQILEAFGPEYRTGTLALRILVVGMYVDILFGPVATLLMLCGQSRRSAQAAMFGLVMLVILLVFFADTLVQAAVAVTLPLLARTILCSIFVRRSFGGWVVPFFDRANA